MDFVFKWIEPSDFVCFGNLHFLELESFSLDINWLASCSQLATCNLQLNPIDFSMSLWLVARKKVPNNCAIVSSEVKLFGRVVAIYGFKWNCVCWFVRVFVFLRVDSDKQTLKFNWPKPNSTHSQIPLYFSSANSCCFTILLAAFFYFLCVIDPLCVVFLIAKSKQSKTCASIDLLLLGDRSLNSQWMSEQVNERMKERNWPTDTWLMTKLTGPAHLIYLGRVWFRVFSASFVILAKILSVSNSMFVTDSISETLLRIACPKSI